MTTIKTNNRIVPNIDVVRPNGSKARFAINTTGDVKVAKKSEGTGMPVTLDDIREAKAFIALDASDGKLDLCAGGIALQTPMHTIFWTNNSAARMLNRLATGQRTLRVGGKDVETTPALNAWVLGTSSLESAEV